MMKVLKLITPLLLAAVGAVFFLLNFLLGNETAELKTPVIPFTLLLAAGCVAVDFFIKKIFKPKLLWLWIIELMLMFTIVYVWIIQ